jgi:hypothetical protein
VENGSTQRVGEQAQLLLRSWPMAC